MLLTQFSPFSVLRTPSAAELQLQIHAHRATRYRYRYGYGYGYRCRCRGARIHTHTDAHTAVLAEFAVELATDPEAVELQPCEPFPFPAPPAAASYALFSSLATLVHIFIFALPKVKRGGRRSTVRKQVQMSATAGAGPAAARVCVCVCTTFPKVCKDI